MSSVAYEKLSVIEPCHNEKRRIKAFLPSLRDLKPSWTMVHFGLSSCFCLLIDKGVFAWLCLALESTVGRGPGIAVSAVVARLVSGNVNYAYNQRVVFRKRATWRSYVQYWGLVVVNMSLSVAMTELATMAFDAHGLMIVVMNVCADVLLFLFSYLVQRLFIFRR